MLFGLKEAFAIEAMVEPDLVPPSTVWGRMRIWCMGTSFGDYDGSHCGLPAEHLQELSAEVQDLWHASLDGLSDTEIFQRLDGLLFGYRDGAPLHDTRSLDDCHSDAHTYSRFSFLTNWEEMFNSTAKCFVVCPDRKTVKVIQQASPAAACKAFTFSATALQDACTQFGLWYADQSARLR
jgi:hypothetical protein